MAPIRTRVAVLHALVEGIEAAIEGIAPLRWNGTPEPKGALCRLERGGVDGAEQGGRRDHERELRVHLACQAGQEGRGQEHRHQHQRDADNRAHQRIHGGDRGVVAGHALLDIVRGALDDDDGIVDDNADREHDGEQRREIDREPHRRHRSEGTDNGHRHRRGRHQHRPPILQEHQDNNENQDGGLDQVLLDLDMACWTNSVVSKGME